MIRNVCFILVCLILMIGANACSTTRALPTAVAEASTPTSVSLPATAVATESAGMPATSTATATPGETPTLAPAPTQAPWRVGIVPGVPPELIAGLREWLDTQAEDRFVLAEDAAAADVVLKPQGGEPLATWVYAVVVPFATLDETTTLSDLQTNWRNGGAPQALVDETTGPLLAAAWGQGNGEIVEAQSLVAELWQRRPSWSIVPFHQLDPRLKVLSVDGISPLDDTFDTTAYPLTFTFGLEGDGDAVAALRDGWTVEATNRDPSHITRLAMTGVTALVRATAYQMEIRGPSYPGEEVGPVLQAVDLAHASNEVSFVSDCPTPHYIGDPVFCSSPRYLALLQEIGIDVVELTGNHLNDWGAQYLPYTLDLYDEAGMRYFGGGRNVMEAQEPLLIEHNGNSIAFVGCNPVGPFGAWATTERAGSAPCDGAAFRSQIGALRQAGHMVVATQQYQEIYHYAPTAQQQVDFRALAEAGAAAVSGSQGHHIQGFDFHERAFIHYGLGNLFFDQMDMLGTRQTTVDIYTVYDNQLLNVQLWTGLIENYARPRQMSAQERNDLLQTLFAASGW